MSSQIVGGITPHHYHTLPNPLSLLKTSPLRENIFAMLGQISDEQFPEFVKDILTGVEGHILIDITDGPGDEKQDILTLNPAGQRCLTQCKHTINYKKNYNGDELDLMVVACMRKSCVEAIFVTNSDLTPPAKRYVTDKEYLREQQNMVVPISVDYWNDIRIWEKIKNHPGILNKWFSGLSLTNAVRSFRFDVSVKKLPVTDQQGNSISIKEIAQLMIDARLIAIDDDQSMSGNIEGHQIHIVPNVEVDANLGVHYKSADNGRSIRNQPLATLQITVLVDKNLDIYEPLKIKDHIVKTLFEPVLPLLPNGEWWHIPTGRSTSFTYLFDINEPREIILDKGSSYVGLSNHIDEELTYCSLKEPEFTAVKHDEEDLNEDDEVFTYLDTDIEISQWFENELDPISTYNYQIEQLYRIDELKDLQFKAVTGIDKTMLMRVRRVLPLDYTAFQYNDDTLMWAVPKDADREEDTRTDNKLRAIKIEHYWLKMRIVMNF